MHFIYLKLFRLSIHIIPTIDLRVISLNFLRSFVYTKKWSFVTLLGRDLLSYLKRKQDTLVTLSEEEDVKISTTNDQTDFNLSNNLDRENWNSITVHVSTNI